MDPQILAGLRISLAKLYPDESSIRRIIDDSGIGILRILLNSTPINNWHSVLIEAERLNCIDALLSTVELEYGNNKEFRRSCDIYRQSMGQSIHDTNNGQNPNALKPRFLSNVSKKYNLNFVVVLVLGFVIILKAWWFNNRPNFPTTSMLAQMPLNTNTSISAARPTLSVTLATTGGAYSIVMSFKISSDTPNGTVVARISEPSLNSTNNVYSVIYRIAPTGKGYPEVAIFDGVMRKCNMDNKGTPLRVDGNNLIILDVNLKDGPGVLLNSTKTERPDGYHERCDPITDNGTPVTLPPSETSPIGQVCLFNNVLSLEKKQLLFKTSSGICLQ